MAPVYLVNMKRFLREIDLHKDILKTKPVNWTMNPKTGKLNFYLNATNGTEVYLHIHQGGEIPVKLKELMIEDFMILGTLEDYREEEEENIEYSEEVLRA